MIRSRAKEFASIRHQTTFRGHAVETFYGQRTRGTEKPMDFAVEGLPPAEGAHQGTMPIDVNARAREFPRRPLRASGGCESGSEMERVIRAILAPTYGVVRFGGILL